MRLLDTHTGQFVDKSPRTTTYAILSHTWGEREQTYQELREIQTSYGDDGRPRSISARLARSLLYLNFGRSPALRVPSHGPSHPPDVASIWDDPRLSPKVRDACALARKEGYDYLWIDSCCIDKTSSSELTEAINSMYKWYASADVCYAFLADVPRSDQPDGRNLRLRGSRWFRRGWTLQELIAPGDVIFLSQDWNVIGSKHDLVELIEDVTGISGEALLHEMSLDEFSVAQRLSWASRRQTTREEDRAYSLLGIFNINMPTLYGEGDGAFRRLQEEIIRRIPDQSIFAWSSVYLDSDVPQSIAATGERESRGVQCREYRSRFGQSFLTPFLGVFNTCGSIKAVSHDDVFRRLQLPDLPAIDYASTPHGIRTQVPVIPLSLYLPPNATQYEGPPSEWFLAILGCEHTDRPGHLLGRACRILPSASGIEVLRVGLVVLPRPERGDYWSGLFPLSAATIERCRSAIVLKTVYISHPDREDWALEAARRPPSRTINLTLSRQSCKALRAQGYTPELRGPDQDHPRTHELTLFNDEHTIVLKFEHALEPEREGQELTIRGTAQMSRTLLDYRGEGDDQADPRTPAVSMEHWRGGRFYFSSLDKKRVRLTAPGVKAAVAVSVGFELAARSRFFLLIDVLTDTTAAASSSIDAGVGEER